MSDVMHKILSPAAQETRNFLQSIGQGNIGDCHCSAILGAQYISDILEVEHEFVAGQAAYCDETKVGVLWSMLGDVHNIHTLEDFVRISTEGKEGSMPCHCWVVGGGKLYDFAYGMEFNLKEVFEDRSLWADSGTDEVPLYIPNAELTKALLEIHDCEGTYL